MSDESLYLQRPTPSVVQARTQDFINATSNAALSTTACVVCAREVFSKECQHITVAQIPNLNLLIPSAPHPAQAITAVGTHGILLHPRTYSSEEMVDVCATCHQALSRRKCPKWALANDMWIGDVPTELQGLTLPERLLIGLYIPCAHVVKLYPKASGASFWNPESMYDGLKGNVSSFPLDQRQVADMLDIVKPAPLTLLSATMVITYVGPKNRPLHWLHGHGLPANFKVRRLKVAKALAWLKDNNPLYARIEISQERVDALPLNAVPEELYEIMRTSDDVDALAEEHSGYVPEHPDAPLDHSLNHTTSEVQQMLPHGRGMQHKRREDN